MTVLSFIFFRFHIFARDDIHCGSKACTTCPKPTVDAVSSEPGIAERDPIPLDNPAAHYLLLDTNVVLHQIDFLEAKPFRNVIVFVSHLFAQITTTVLDEVRHRSIPIYNRIRKIISDPENKYYVFANENHR